DQEIVWAKGFGFANPQAKIPATADTVYRVGSVSKLFTDIAVMQLVEQGQLDLDAPVTRYLPDFRPINPFHKPITLRQLMTHRSGLVREPPVGHYFDDRKSSLEEMVRSLNRTTLIYEPESRIKYSNAAIGVVGYVLQQTQKAPFAKYLQEKLLDPMGMKRSSFEPKPALTRDLAHSLMWTYHGREFEAPTFEMGIAPAGRKVGHNGAIYGFATELSALPADKLGVVVIASRDVANAVTTHIADVALRQMLAVRRQEPPPKIEETSPLKPEIAGRWAGRY